MCISYDSHNKKETVSLNNIK